MKIIQKQKWLSIITAFIMTVTCLMGAIPNLNIVIDAASVDYPAQLMNIASKDNSTVLTENGITDGSGLSMKALGSDLSPSWRFDRVGADSNGTYFKIVNAQSGRLLTPLNYNVSAGASVVIYGSESAKSQHWYVVPVSTDRLGNNLYYKIVNYSNTSLALTQGTSGMTLANYTGADNQLWLLNADGLQGFAGYCKDDNTGKVKAANIGGLFGEVVEVSTFADLKKYATSDTPYTIVVTKNISVTELNMNGTRYMCTAGRIYVHSNKTIIGSYSANTLFNVQFCTSTNSGKGDNIIIKNFDMQHDAESNNNDSIVCYFGSGQNIWVDHVTFTGHSNYGYAPQTGQVDEDKFLACCYDADYCTISDCSFGAHKYGLILGYPADGANDYNNYNNYPRMSIISNKFYDTNTRGPGLMRYGYFHSLNNYVDKFSMAYTVWTASKIYAENCYYANGGNVICDWGDVTYPGFYSESGSTFVDCGRTVQGAESNSTASACTWRPNTNYTYVSLSAANAKTYTTSYSGRQTSKSNMMYLRFANKGVPGADYVEVPSGKIGASFDTTHKYRFVNASSGLSLEVADGAAQSGANVQQGNTGADGWTLVEAGDGYYYIYSEVGDGKTFVLDLPYGSTENGTSIGIWTNSQDDSKMFKFVDNGDGTYTITTKPTDDQSCIGIQSGSKDAGADALQWTCDGSDNQKWIVEIKVDPVDGNLIRNLIVEDVTTYQNWSIDESIALGDLVFGDRDVTFTALPDEILGAEAIITACDAKNSADNLASFTAGADITVYVALDSRVSSIPAWLSDYTKTELTATNNKDVIFELYSKSVKKDEKVILGTNGQVASCVNYTVFAVETNKEPEIIKGDVNADRQLTVADAVMMQKWLINTGDLTDWTVGDLCEDGRIDAFDYIKLRRLLLSTLVEGREFTFEVADNLFNQSNTDTLGLSAPEGLQTYTVWKAEEEGDHYCNGVSLAGYKDKLYCMWQSSETDEDSADTRVMYAVSADGGKTWTEPKQLVQDIAVAGVTGDDTAYCSSGGWLATDNQLVAYINVWPGIEPRGGYTYYMTTQDGTNWSEPKPVMMADGTQMNAIFEQDPHVMKNGRIVNAAHFQDGLIVSPIYTDDPNGITGWKKGNFTATVSGTSSKEMEPSLFVQSDGTIVMIFRDQNSSYTKLVSYSYDNGETWSEVISTDMPDARTKQSAGNLSDGTAFMAGCPVNNSLRSPLAITLSADGKAFDHAYLLRSNSSDPELVYEGQAKRKGFHYCKSLVYNGYLIVGYATNKEAVEISIVPEESLMLN